MEYNDSFVPKSRARGNMEDIINSRLAAIALFAVGRAGSAVEPVSLYYPSLPIFDFTFIIVAWQMDLINVAEEGFFIIPYPVGAKTILDMYTFILT